MYQDIIKTGIVYGSMEKYVRAEPNSKDFFLLWPGKLLAEIKMSNIDSIFINV